MSRHQKIAGAVCILWIFLCGHAFGLPNDFFSQRENIDLQGSLSDTVDSGTYGGSIEVASGHAFVASRVTRVVDISDPTAPHDLVSYAFGGSAPAAISGGILCQAEDAGLRTANVSNPFSPTRQGFCPFQSWYVSVAISGDYAYTTSNGGVFEVFDISDTSAPRIAGGYWFFTDFVGNVAIAGRRAYAAFGDAGLLIFDISNPASPVLLKQYTAAGIVSGVDIDERGLVYLTSNTGLSILNVEDPASPGLAGHWDGVCPMTSPNVRSLVVRGKLAYVIDRSIPPPAPFIVDPFILQVLDVSNPAVPKHRGGCVIGRRGDAMSGMAVDEMDSICLTGWYLQSTYLAILRYTGPKPITPSAARDWLLYR